jgi:DNA modification methylase
MYFYPDNIQESILIFQKGKFDYNYVRELDSKTKQGSRIDIGTFQKNKWHLTVWDITNVLPLEGRVEKGIAAFPDEIPSRLIKLFSYVGETVLDPFLGSGTTTKVARSLGRNTFGYELDIELVDVVKRKLNYQQLSFSDDTIEIIVRQDAKKLRTSLQKLVARQKSVAKKNNLPLPVSNP